MNARPDEAAVENGSLLRLGTTREIAIYRRHGAAWVADFRGAHGELYTASAWFALNGGGSALRCAKADPIAPLPADMIGKIEQLHAAEHRPPPATPGASLRDFAAMLFHEPSRCTGALGPRTQRS